MRRRLVFVIPELPFYCSLFHLQWWQVMLVPAELLRRFLARLLWILPSFHRSLRLRRFLRWSITLEGKYHNITLT